MTPSAIHFPIRRTAPLTGPYGPLPVAMAPPDNGPSALRLAHNAAAAATRFVVAALHNAPLTTDIATRDLRRQICLTCPSNFWRPDLARCMHPQCGCYGRPKTALATETCPASHWPPAPPPR